GLGLSSPKTGKPVPAASSPTPVAAVPCSNSRRVSFLSLIVFPPPEQSLFVVSLPLRHGCAVALDCVRLRTALQYVPQAYGPANCAPYDSAFIGSGKRLRTLQISH